MRALGLMSGTSADGVDAAIIETDGHKVTAFGPAATIPFEPALRHAILAVMADPDRAETEPLPELEASITAANATAARAIMGDIPVDVVGMHGQTLLHRPERRFTRQIGDGAALARALRTSVVNRFRDADVAAGGQGAPLVPLFHQALLAGTPGPTMVLNLGGVANVTYVDGPALLAFDTGPASALLDDWTARHTGAPFDQDGALAASGTVDEPALAALLAHPFFLRPPPKSLDRNAFALDAVRHLNARDGAATLLAFTIRSIAAAQAHLPRPPTRWLVAGGGRHNGALMRSLAAALDVPVAPVDTLGWNGDALEAQAFAFLAVRSLLGLPLSLPGTTGVPGPLTGGTIHRIDRDGTGARASVAR